MTATRPSVEGQAAVGASGWSYPSWRPDFYPAGSRNEDFLRYYGERLPAVELNATGYRLPSEEQFRRWAEQTPPGFRFAVKAPRLVYREPEVVLERVRALGDRLGCVRVVVESPRSDELLERLATSATQAGVRLALDLRNDSWESALDLLDAAGIASVGAWESRLDWRYVRFRESPWSDAELEGIASRLRPLVASGLTVFGFFRHETLPTAPAAALRVLELVSP
jgi:uncharacterized protein YecE (DUF72 family)